MADRVMRIYYGPEFVVATTALLILLPGTIAFSAARPLKAIAQGSGRLRTLAVAMGAAAGLNVALNALLIPRYGMTGAAVATSVGYASMFAFTVVAARRIGFHPLSDLRPVRIALTAGLTAVPVVGLNRLLAPDVFAFAVVPPVGGAVFLLAAVATGALDRDDLDPVVERLPARYADAVASATARIEP
jgi:O-antigen/teichoic acid export membrane protein